LEPDPRPTPNHGVSMARRSLQRRRTCAYDQVVLECTQQAGELVPLADPHCADWHAGFQAGLHGESYVYPLNCDEVSWRAGFIEGAAHRLRRLAAIRVTLAYARSLWALPK
jgi:hypothetical protein